ncbi:MAG: STAS domain-containing protein [Eubacterium sp.]
MNIEQKKDGGKIILLPEGKVDTLTAPELSEAVEGVAEDVKELILDFSGVSYISSAGLRTLLNAHKKMVKQGGEMKVTQVNDTVMEVFAMTGFDAMLSIG